MQENEFEKQVQQKMEDLKLQPSDAVWNKIEPQIKKDERRRWAIILLPILFIGLLYGGYSVIKTSPDETVRGHLTDNTIQKKSTFKQPPVKFEGDKKNKFLTQDTHRTNKTFALSNSSPKSENRSNSKTNNNYKVKNQNTKSNYNQKRELSSTIIIENDKVIVNPKNTELEIPFQGIKKPTTTVTTDAKEVAVKQMPDPSNIALVQDDSTINNKKQNILIPKIKHRWSFGLTISAGVSGTVKGLGSGQKSFAAVSSSGSSPGFNPVPSLIKPSTAFIAGFSAEKNISKNTVFITGLNYKLFKPQNTVGSDSAAFFRNINTVNKYTNYYHYLELPAELKFKIIDLKKVTLHLNTGFSLSGLINSTALQFNDSTGLYYRDNSQLNKIVFGFNTGADIELPSKHKRAFLFGPYFNYGVTRTANKGYNKHHFTFIGIRAKIIFKR
jgi:hypothetical protein